MPDEEPYPWPSRSKTGPPDFSGFELLDDRWEKASSAPAGHARDENAIRALALEHLQSGEGESDRPKLHVGPIRWLSADEVMVSASEYSGPLAAASYYYVVQRHPQGWRILHRYMLTVS